MSNLLNRLLFLTLILPSAVLAQTVSLKVQHHGFLADTTREIARRFMDQNPDVRIDLLSPVESYDAVFQQTLRDAATGQVPDLGFHGINLVGHLAERDLAVPLDALIVSERDWPSMGFPPSVRWLTEFGGKMYGLPFAVSLPVVFYNADLVRRAGGDPNNLPNSWSSILDLARKVQALQGDTIGAFIDWDSQGNWMFQALLFSRNGRMTHPDGTSIAFDSAEGLAALRTLRDFADAGMVDMSRSQSWQSFASGKLGILVSGSALLNQLTEQAGGRFQIRTSSFPVSEPHGRLPAGGAAIVIQTKDPLRQQAAWKFVKFAAGPIGQTIMVRSRGYVPSNTLVSDEDLLGSYFAERPNHRTAFQQVPIMTAWYTFPGPNAIKIGASIRDHMRSVVVRQRTPEEAMAAMVRDAKALLSQ